MIIILSYSQTEAILYRYCRMSIEEERLKLEIEELEKDKGSLKGVNYDGMPVEPLHIGDPIATEVIERERKIAKLKYRLRLQELQRETIELTLEQLEEDLQRLFKAQYITNCRDTKSNIARRLNISRTKYYSDKDKLVNIFIEVLSKYDLQN